MKRRLTIFTGIIIIVTSADAARITGTVIQASGDTATVKVEGANAPAPGDTVEIFFNLAGTEEEVSVASGTVSAINPDSIQVKINKATGTVEKDQVVRISSDNPQKRTIETSPATTTSPSFSAEAEKDYALGWEYLRGGGSVRIDQKKAFELFQRAADQGMPQAQARLATSWRSVGYCDFIHPADEVKALDWAQRALANRLEERATKEVPDAEFELSLLYEAGLGVQKNEGKTVHLLEQAASQGNHEAERHLGFLYCSGSDGLGRDTERGLEFLSRAASANLANAQVLLYVFTTDKAKAIEPIRKAADQGYAPAISTLAHCYEIGQGVTADKTMALELYERAAQRGYWEALQKLGEVYEKGDGVPRDLAKAISYYRQVADQGIKSGKEALARLGSTTSSQTVPPTPSIERAN